MHKALFELKQYVRSLNRQRLQKRRERATTSATMWLKKKGTPSDQQLKALAQENAALNGSEIVTHVLLTIEAATAQSSKKLNQTMSSLRLANPGKIHFHVVNRASTPLPNHALDLTEHASIEGFTRSICDDNANNLILCLTPGTSVYRHSLLLLINEALKHPEQQIFYSDCALACSQGPALEFKPQLAYDYLLSYGYIEGFCAIRVGAWRHDHWRSVFSLIETTGSSAFKHIPWVLCETELNLHRHTARHPELQKHLDRSAPGAQAEILPDHQGIRVHWPIPSPAPKVSLIIPTKDQGHLLGKCLSALLLKTDYPDLEIVVVDNGTTEANALQLLQRASLDPRVRLVVDNAPFNYSRLNNHAVRTVATGEFLCFMNNDVEAISPDWLTQMIGIASRPDVGCVGAKLLYGDGTVQHGGVVLGIGSDGSEVGVAAHVHKALGAREPGYASRAILDQNYSAVTAACLVVRKDVFLEVGGFNEADLAVAYNDIDLCLKIRSLGKQVVWSAHSVLYHHESISRGKDTTQKNAARFSKEVEYMRKTWHDILMNDPFYNPNLSLRYANFAPRS